MRPLLLVCLLLSVATPAFAVLGDLDLDGDVDFDDFFLFVDNFGKTGPPDTLRVVVRDTLVVEQTVDVFDTTWTALHVTVFDTVSVEFVEPPDEIPTERPDWIIRDERTGESLSTLKVKHYSDDFIHLYAHISLFYREPIDDEDYPYIDVNYDRIPVSASFDVQYTWFQVAENLNISAPDTVQLRRDVRLLQGNRGIMYDMFFLDTERFPDVASTMGELILDVVLRTPVQGDFAGRGISPVTVSDNGKIQLYRD